MFYNCNIICINFFFTESDKKGEKTTINRCLQKHLVLVTQIKLGNDYKTVFPQGLWKEGETLRQVHYVFLLLLIIICIKYKLIFMNGA